MFTCTVCRQWFVTQEALSKHLKSLIIKTMCSCQKCGKLFGPDYHCSDPVSKKTFHCFICKTLLKSTQFKKHLCFHGSVDVLETKRNLQGNDSDKSRYMRKKNWYETSLYSKIRSEYAKARERYFEKVNKIKEGSYVINEWMEDNAGDSNTDCGMNTFLEVEIADRSDDDTDLCIFCSKEVPLSDLAKHENQHRSEKSFKTLSQKTKGLVVVESEITPERKSLCFICGELVKSKNFRSHKQYHNRVVETVVCEICGFGSKNIKQHMATHSDQRKYSCEICGLSFKTNHTLKVHSLVHTNVGKYKCNTCEKRFKTHYNLKVHMRSHMDKKPFECDVCEKSFTTKQWRDNHMKTHKI